MGLKVLVVLAMAMATCGVTALPQCVCVATQSSPLNIRSCPSAGCSIIGSAPKGSCLTYSGNSAGVWIEIIQKGAQDFGWVHSDYTTPPHTCSECVWVTATSLNVRECDSTSCGIVGVVNKGNELMYNDVSPATWHNVVFEDNGEVKQGFVHGGYTSSVSACKGCAANLCSSFSSNEARGTDAFGSGAYGAPRGNRAHNGIDIKCTMGDTVYAPYDGEVVRVAKPYGNGYCCDTGLEYRVAGAGDFTIKMFYVSMTVSVGTQLQKGAVLAEHIGLHCGCYNTSMRDHTHFELRMDEDVIDPTSYAIC